MATEKIFSTDLSLIAEDYFACIKKLCKRENAPKISSFKDDYYQWLITDAGEIDIDDIPENDDKLAACRSEIERLTAENHFTSSQLIEAINDTLSKKW